MRIGTRGSALARVQAEAVKHRLVDALGAGAELVIVRTQGDRVTDRPLRALQGQGFFTKEIEQALLDGRIDLAVHSFKDLPSRCAPGLEVVAVTSRADPADLLVVRTDACDPGADFVPIKEGACVGTSAVRRQSQLATFRKDIVFRDLRGNVPTRLGKLARGDYDAIFVAAAAVQRLDLRLDDFHVVRLDPRRFIPAPGQGALAVEMRSDHPAAGQIRDLLEDSAARMATRIERGVEQRFGGGCSLPLGAYAALEDERWRVSAFWGGEGGGRHGEVVGVSVSDIADRLFEQLKV